jgi:hypothetical protein
MTFTIALSVTVVAVAVLFIGMNVFMGMVTGATFWETVAVSVAILVALVLMVGFAFGIAAMWEAVP